MREPSYHANFPWVDHSFHCNFKLSIGKPAFWSKPRFRLCNGRWHHEERGNADTEGYSALCYLLAT